VLEKAQDVTTEPPARPRIADIIRDSGKMGTDQPGASQEQLAAIAAVISGGSAATFAASETIVDELAKRFNRLSTNAGVERDLDAPYETAGRALILALQARNAILNSAFDTASGAIIEASQPMSLFAPKFTIAIAIADHGATTHISAQTQHIGIDFGQNAKLLDALFDATNDYLKLFKS
jgi:hypothetical protein